MTKILNTLRCIERDMEKMGDTIRREANECNKELEERLRLGLHGEDAVRHYNEWMDRCGMGHLKVKEDG